MSSQPSINHFLCHDELSSFWDRNFFLDCLKIVFFVSFNPTELVRDSQNYIVLVFLLKRLHRIEVAKEMLIAVSSEVPVLFGISPTHSLASVFFAQPLS